MRLKFPEFQRQQELCQPWASELLHLSGQAEGPLSGCIVFHIPIAAGLQKGCVTDAWVEWLDVTGCVLKESRAESSESPVGKVLDKLLGLARLAFEEQGYHPGPIPSVSGARHKPTATSAIMGLQRKQR